jgi:hypothetical protein
MTASKSSMADRMASAAVRVWSSASARTTPRSSSDKLVAAQPRPPLDHHAHGFGPLPEPPVVILMSCAVADPVEGVRVVNHLVYQGPGDLLRTPGQVLRGEVDLRQLPGLSQE